MTKKNKNMGQPILLVKCILYIMSIVCWAFLLQSCGKKNFADFEHSEISYQIYPAKNYIIRLKRTNGEGLYSLQLFDKNGGLVENIIMATPFPFIITKWNDNAIEITYYVAKSDLIFFLPWFKSYKENPSRIGDHRINYSYSIYDEDGIDKVEHIDSLFFEIRDTTVRMINHNKMLLKVPVPELFVYKNKFRYYNSEDKSTTEIFPTDSILVSKFLNEIISLYLSRK